MATAVDLRAYTTFQGNHLKKSYTVTMSNSYTTGGELIDLSADFGAIDSAVVLGDSIFSGTLFVGEVSALTAGCKAYDNNLAEVTATTDQSNAVMTLQVEGVPVGGVSSGSEI